LPTDHGRGNFREGRERGQREGEREEEGRAGEGITQLLLPQAHTAIAASDIKCKFIIHYDAAYSTTFAFCTV